MKFSYSTIGDNTQENREWLEKLGYKVNHSSDDRFLRTYEDGSTKISHFKNWIYEDKQPINCIGNSPLFKAVSAMRDDSDYMQWFIADNDWMLWDNPKRPQMDMFNYSEDGGDASEVGVLDEIHGDYFAFNPYHKATLTELQEKFKL